MVIWFTGLSGAGKTTIAILVKQELEKMGKRVVLLDGDDIRVTRHRHLGFTREDIRENNRCIAELARARMAQTDFVLVPIISPYRDDRATARKAIGKHFIEVYVNCPVEMCAKRDTKGLYAKAKAGEMNNLIGVSVDMPYEAPEHPELETRSAEETPAQSVARIIAYLQRHL